MRFIQYRRAEARACKIDWDGPVEITDELRRSLHPHEPRLLRAGRLRRPFLFEAPVPGRRSHAGFVRHAPPKAVLHQKGALVFAYPDESSYLIEAADGES